MPVIAVTVQAGSTLIAPGGSTSLTATVANTNTQSVTWSTTAGTVTPTGPLTATFTAPATSGAATITATSVADPSRFGTVAIQYSTSTRYQGFVYREGSTLGLAGVQVRFYNASGGTVTTTTTNSSGVFSVVVPTSAVRFHILNASVPAGYYKAYKYNGLRYTTLEVTCSAPLPPPIPGGTVNLPTAVTVPPTTGPPPPPPNGCT